MAFDGITVSALTKELNDKLLQGRISKISQPEKNEILLLIKNEGENYRLFISASASLPVMYLTEENKPSPMTAPPFCMLLRKYLQGARITEISQPGLERVIRIKCEHLNEMGDVCFHVLTVELMGKHSNIILTDDKGIVTDSIKRVSALMSSVREVLPGKEYFIPFTDDRADALNTGDEKFKEIISASGESIDKAIYKSFTGISPFIAGDMCLRAGVDPRKTPKDIDESEMKQIRMSFCETVDEINRKSFTPCILKENGRMKDYCVTGVKSYNEDDKVRFESVSEMLYCFYSTKNKSENMKQKGTDLKKKIATILERDIKKRDLQAKQLEDSNKRDKYRIYGELINTYGYGLTGDETVLTAVDYMTGEEVKIPLEKGKTAGENAKKYFDKYSKLRRTAEAVAIQLEETDREIAYLENISTFLAMAETEGEISQIKEELSANGFIRRSKDKVKREKAKPLHYTTPDGYDIYVGKNNVQNDELTFKFASGNDWWFHAKGVPGSHVVVRCSFANQAEEWDMPDEVFEAAGALAVKYSKNSALEKAEVDYLRRKNVKKPAGAQPGFVVYYTNYSLVASSDTERFALTMVKS